MKKVYLIALIVALFVGGATYLFAQGLVEKSHIQDAPTQDVVVALADVPAGTMITAEMVESTFSTSQILLEDVVPEAITDVGLIVGQVAAQDLYQGEQISMRRMAAAGSDETGLSYSLKEGEVAYSIKASADKGVDGYIKPGDTIDIVVVNETAEGKIIGANIEFQDLKVIKVATYQEVSTAKQDTTTDGEVKTYTSVTVKTTEDVAAKLYAMEATSMDRFKLVLNSRVDAEKVD